MYRRTFNIMTLAALALAPRYHNAAPGELGVKREGGKVVFDVGAVASEVVTRPEADGTLAFVTIDPIAVGFPFVRADQDGLRRLIVRDGQHECVFEEVK